MPSGGRVLVLAWIVVVACDDAPAPAEPPRVVESAPVADAAERVVAPAPVRSSAPVVSAADPSEAIVEPPPPESAGDETFEALVARLVEDVPPTPDPGAAAFVHYRAKAFGKAQALFALAAREDTAWKHPFNLACASARAGDEVVTRVALREAVRRGGAAVVRKAQRDADLASMRDRAWFARVLEGEPSVAAAPEAVEEAVPPEPDPAPAIEPAPDLPRGTNTPIAKADLEAVVAALSTVHHARPKVRGSIAVEGSGALGFAMYEVSRYEACVGADADPKKARRRCRAQFRGDEEEGRPDEMKCTDQYVVHVASFAPLEVDTPTRLTDDTCTMRVRRFVAHDLDADGQQEVLLETLGHSFTPEFRVGEQDDWTRMFRVLRLDGTVQLALDVRWDRHAETTSGTAHRLGLRDDDGDGHPDLVIATRSFQTQEDLDVDDMLWPKPDSDLELELGPVEVVRWSYDAAEDAWIDPAPRR